MAPASLDIARWTPSELVLLDIEGTLSSISFVKDVMYPYALDQLTRLARDSWADAQFQHLILPFPHDTKQDADTLIAHVEQLTRQDIKAAYLKQLQGHLWTTGFANGDLKTPLFEDVLPSLKAWKAAGKTLAIFSSGSVQAQLQFFAHVQQDGATLDITSLFSAHYDTVNAGSKVEKHSYEKICEAMGKDVSRVTFLTDNVKEAQAATQANLYAIVVDRPGNAPLSDESKATYPVIESLAALPMGPSSKS